VLEAFSRIRLPPFRGMNILFSANTVIPFYYTAFQFASQILVPENENIEFGYGHPITPVLPRYQQGLERRQLGFGLPHFRGTKIGLATGFHALPSLHFWETALTRGYMLYALCRELRRGSVHLIRSRRPSITGRSLYPSQGTFRPNRKSIRVTGGLNVD